MNQSGKTNSFSIYEDEMVQHFIDYLKELALKTTKKEDTFKATIIPFKKESS